MLSVVQNLNAVCLRLTSPGWVIRDFNALWFLIHRVNGIIYLHIYAEVIYEPRAG